MDSMTDIIKTLVIFHDTYLQSVFLVALSCDGGL